MFQMFPAYIYQSPPPSSTSHTYRHKNKPPSPLSRIISSIFLQMIMQLSDCGPKYILMATHDHKCGIFVHYHKTPYLKWSWRLQQHFPPVSSVDPSMIRASTSTVVSSVTADPWPALKIGSSSMALTANSTASTALPPYRKDKENKWKYKFTVY